MHPLGDVLNFAISFDLYFLTYTNIPFAFGYNSIPSAFAKYFL